MLILKLSQNIQDPAAQASQSDAARPPEPLKQWVKTATKIQKTYRKKKKDTQKRSKKIEEKDPTPKVKLAKQTAPPGEGELSAVPTE